MGLREELAVIGVGCTKFGDLYEKSPEDMIVEATYEAYQDAGIAPEQIEAAWVGTLSSGVSGASLADVLKLPNVPISRVENYCVTGMDAFRNACFGVASGMYDIVLAVGFEKLKDSGMRGLGGAAGHPVIGRGATAPGMFALAGTRYLHEFKLDRSVLSRVAVKNHYNGARNPKAHFQKEITEEQAINAPMIAWPLGLYDCCPTTDGAAAVIVTRKEIAKTLKDDYVSVKGIGFAVTPTQPQYKPGYDYVHFPCTTIAAQQAYEQAGIKNPAEEIDFVECHDCFTITEVLNYEDLLLCEKGTGWQFIADGHATLQGKLPVNPSGGLKTFGHPIGATGIRMIYETTKQLQGKGGERQVKDAEIGVAHNLGGAPTVACVSVLTNRPD